jgi:hypothetical protein
VFTRLHWCASGGSEDRVSAKDETLRAELHAHAGQLMTFCKDHKLGFLVALIDDAGEVHRVTNMSDEGLAHTGRMLQDPGPDVVVTHHTAEKPS